MLHSEVHSTSERQNPCDCAKRSRRTFTSSTMISNQTRSAAAGPKRGCTRKSIEVPAAGHSFTDGILFFCSLSRVLHALAVRKATGRLVLGRGRSRGCGRSGLPERPDRS